MVVVESVRKIVVIIVIRIELYKRGMTNEYLTCRADLKSINPPLVHFTNLGCKPSGPGDFPVLRFCNNFLTSSIEKSSGDCCTIGFSSNLTNSPSGSFVNILAKY